MTIVYNKKLVFDRLVFYYKNNYVKKSSCYCLHQKLLKILSTNGLKWSIKSIFSFARGSSAKLL